MAGQLHLHLGRSVHRAPSLQKPAVSLPKSKGEDDRCVILKRCAAHHCVIPTAHTVTAPSSVRLAPIPVLGYR